MPVWRRFNGMSPGLSPAHLPSSFAQEAVNCFIGKGDALYPERAPLDLNVSLVNPDGSPFAGTPRQLWRSGDVYVAWDHWVHVIDDPRQWSSPNAFLYVDNGKLIRSSDVWIKQGKPPRAIGINRPDQAPTVSAGAAGSMSFSAPPAHLPTNSTNTPPSCPTGAQPGEARSYVVCAVNDMLEESAPSLPSDIVLIQPEVAVTVQYAGTPPEGTTAYRWYRTLPGKNLPEYRFVAETTLPILLDTYDALQLSDPLETREHFPPMGNIEGVAYLGSKDIVVWSGQTIWPSVSRLPHAFAPASRYDVPYNVVTVRSTPPVVTGGQMGSASSTYSAFILTERKPYLLEPIPPTSAEAPSITSRIHSINVDEPCVGPQCATTGEGCVFYSSPRGIISLALGSRPEGATDEIFTLLAWRDWRPETFTLAYYQGRIFGFSGNETFVLAASHIDRDRTMSLSLSTVMMTAAYAERGADLLFSNDSRTVHAWGKSATNLVAQWTSRLITESEYFNPGAVKIDMDLPLVASHTARQAIREFEVSGKSVDEFISSQPQYEGVREYLEYSLVPAKIDVYKETKLWSSKKITSRVPHRLPRQGKGIYWHFKLTTDRTVYRVMLTKAIKDMAHEIEPLEE